MTYLAVSAVVFVASVAFVLGFIVGSKFTKVYLKEKRASPGGAETEVLWRRL